MSAPQSRLHLPSLITAVLLMLAGAIYPVMLSNGAGQAQHGVATAVFVAMSAGLVRGVGFLPRARLWRWLFSGWTCALALALAIALKWALPV